MEVTIEKNNDSEEAEVGMLVEHKNGQVGFVRYISGWSDQREYKVVIFKPKNKTVVGCWLIKHCKLFSGTITLKQ